MRKGGLLNAFASWKRRFVKIEGSELLLYKDDGPGAALKDRVALEGGTCRVADFG